MAALGNDTPGARLVLAFVETYAIVASPLWAVPLSYIIGGCFFFSSNPGDRKYQERVSSDGRPSDRLGDPLHLI